MKTKKKFISSTQWFDIVILNNGACNIQKVLQLFKFCDFKHIMNVISNRM